MDAKRTMILFAGLGNPGSAYSNNRHNIGFMAVDAITHRHGFSLWRDRFHGVIAQGRLAGRGVVALKPATLMNRSGQSVGEAMRFYRIDPADTVVFHDELDLEPGRMRVKTGGGLAGHNGLRSIAAHIGPGFRRVRLGIGRPEQKSLVRHYVLRDFSQSDRLWLDPLIEAIATNAELLAAGETSRFADKVRLALDGATAKGDDSPTKCGGT
ncbi:MAG: aminoacyl-tRNA hydrolase [Hyphomicrobiales bacterium]